MRYIFIAVICLSQTAFAQDNSQQADVVQQVLSQKLLKDFNEWLGCTTQAVILQKQLDALKKELADLKAKDAK